MCSNKVYNLGSAQYKVMMFLRSRPASWDSNKKLSYLMGNKKAFSFSGNDARLGDTLYRLCKMGLVEKRDREIMAHNPYSNSPPRKAWITEFRIIDTTSILKTTYLEWETDRPESWHVVQEINGVRHDMGKNW